MTSDANTGTYDRATHWESRWSGGSRDTFSWFEESASSLRIVEELDLDASTPLIDVGGGGAGLVLGLATRGWTDLTVLDISQAALDSTRERMGPGRDAASFICSDVLEFEPTRAYGFWHDRALLHFFTDQNDVARYAACAKRAVPSGHVAISVFSADGPTQCSGLDVRRYDSAMLANVLAPEFSVVDVSEEIHVTPAGGEQQFLTAVFARP